MDTPTRPDRFRAINERTTPASDIASNARPHGIADITPNIELQKQNDPSKPLHRDGSADPPLVPSPLSTASSGRLFSPAASDGNPSSVEPVFPRRDLTAEFSATERRDGDQGESVNYITTTDRRKRSSRDIKSASSRVIMHQYNKDPIAYVENSYSEHKAMSIPSSSYDLGLFTIQSMDPYDKHDRTVLQSADGYLLITQGGEPKELYHNGKRTRFHGELRSSISKKLQDRGCRVPQESIMKTKVTESKKKSLKRTHPQIESNTVMRRETSPRPAKIPRHVPVAKETYPPRGTFGPQAVSTYESTPMHQGITLREEETKPPKTKAHHPSRIVKKPAQSKNALSKSKTAPKRDKEPKSQGAHQQFANAIKGILDSRVPNELQDVEIGGIRIKTSKKECMHVYSDAYDPPTEDLDAGEIESLMADQKTKKNLDVEDFLAKDPLVGEVGLKEAKLAFGLGLHSIHEYITQKRRTMLGMAEMRRQGYESADAHVGKAHFQSFGNIDVNKMSLMYTVFQKSGWLLSAPDDYVHRPLTGIDADGGSYEIKVMPYQGKKRAVSNGP